MLSEYLLDDYEIDDINGVSRTINRPTKYGSNPVFGDDAWTWDGEINYLSLDRLSGTTRMWYRCFADADGNNPMWCYATSTDGIAWTRPTLNLVTYGGNTTNNLLTLSRSACIDVQYNADSTPAYLGCGESKNGTATWGVYLYSSSNGTTWSSTPYKELYTSSSASTDANYREGKCVFRRPDGKWLCYYQQHATANVQRRQIGVYMSDTTDPSGGWTDLGVVIDCQSQEVQRYGVKVRMLGDVYLAWVGRYSRTAESIVTTVWRSRDGINWTLVDDEWMGLGSSGAWDDAQIWATGGFVEHGNDWRHYFVGSAQNHATFPRSSKMGFATLGKGRLVSIGTTGSVRLKLRTLGASDTLTINANASGGSMLVELRDWKNEVIPGYSRTDCTPIMSDTYGTVVSWGGTGLPSNQAVRVVFVLSLATLHSFDFGA